MTSKRLRALAFCFLSSVGVVCFFAAFFIFWEGRNLGYYCGGLLMFRMRFKGSRGRSKGF